MTIEGLARKMEMVESDLKRVQQALDESKHKIAMLERELHAAHSSADKAEDGVHYVLSILASHGLR